MPTMPCSELSVRAHVRLIAPVLVAMVLALLPFVAQAGTITVDGTTCTLPEAITAANTDAAFEGCTAGSGPDTLLLGGLTHSLDTGPYKHDGMNATPSVTSMIVISGGVGGAIVERSGAEKYRLFHVGNTGDLTLRNITIRNGDIETGGGGIYNRGAATFSDSDVFSNTAPYGGGFFNGGTATLVDSEILSNTSKINGGGIYNVGTATLTNSHFIANTADLGGGLYNGGPATLTDSDILSNTADFGGGLHSNGSASTAITITNATIRANVAITSGGAIYKGSSFSGDSGSMTIAGSRFISNHAGLTGSTIQQLDGMTTVDQSCIVNNSDTAINFGDGDPIDAANNWWGAPDGPSGIGPGGGDSVSFGVNFEPFHTTPVAGCPWLTAMVTASTAEATVGETITFTYHITNSSSLTLTTISAVDDQFGPVAALEGPLLPAASRAVTLTHVVEPGDLPGPLTSSVTVTGTDTFGLVVSASDSISVTTLPAVLQPGEIYLPNVLR